jgi:hypothetical protein
MVIADNQRIQYSSVRHQSKYNNLNYANLSAIIMFSYFLRSKTFVYCVFSITGDLSAVATLQSRSNVYFIALNTGRPSNIAQLAPAANVFPVGSASGLLSWSNSINAGRTPIQNFFDQLAYGIGSIVY